MLLSPTTCIMQISLIFSGARQLIGMFYSIISIVPFLTGLVLLSMYYEAQLMCIENESLRRNFSYVMY
jgi:hypothetical protein